MERKDVSVFHSNKVKQLHFLGSDIFYKNDPTSNLNNDPKNNHTIDIMHLDKSLSENDIIDAKTKKRDTSIVHTEIYYIWRMKSLDNILPID